MIDGLRSQLTAGVMTWVLVHPFVLGPQSQPPPPTQNPPAQEPVVLAAAEVIVDVIVTDKKNKLVLDLTPADFEVYEDGVKQDVRSVRLERRDSGEAMVAGDAKPPATETRPSTAPPPVGQPNLVVFVFDNLSLQRSSQVYAQRAARDHLDKIAANDLVAVFGIDTRLFLVQPFTRDREALKRAVEQVTTGNSRLFASSAEAVQRLVESGATPAQPGPASLNSPASPTDILLDTFRSFARLEEEAQARATVLALLSIIRGQQTLPRRKTVILFSEGFSLPTSLALPFKSVIGNANRANVTFYTVDAGGLRLESAEQAASREFLDLAEARARGADPSIVSGGESALGRAESLGRSNRESILIELAESTGGLAIRNTNDLRSALVRIDEDMRHYYVLTYTPVNQNFDGRFRPIEVKVKRPDVRVRSRSGYFALRTTDAALVLPHEQPLFELLHKAAPPADFPITLASVHFPAPPPKLTNSLQVVVEVPGDIIAFTETPAAESKDKNKKDEPKTYAGQVAIMALVKDPQGVIVRKVSQNYMLTVRADRLEGIKKNKIVFYRNTDVEPGLYRIETVARDATTGKASMSHMQVRVPVAASAPLRLSSIVPISGAEPLRPGERNPNNPFHYNNAVVTPKLDRTFKKSADQQLMFYFAVQATPGATVTAKVEFLMDGQVAAQAPGALPPPDAQGRIQFIASFPTAPFPPRMYDVRVTVSDGTHQATEQTSFKVEP
jgi:VWFA-related protein